MTKEEIKALIAEKIAGQGNQVDSGGALADILNGIIDNISREVTIAPEQNLIQSATKAEFAAALHISESDVDKLFETDAISQKGGGSESIVYLVHKFISDTVRYVQFGSVFSTGDGGAEMYIMDSNGEYEYYFNEP